MEYNSEVNNKNSFEQSTENIFFVDTKVGVVKAGVRMKPLILGIDEIMIGKNELHFGFKKLLLDPQFMLAISARVLGGAVGGALTYKIGTEKYKGEVDELLNDLEKIAYKDIKSVNLRKTIVRDLVIDLIYKKDLKDEKISFFVVNQYNTMKKETEKLFNLLKSKVN